MKDHQLHLLLLEADTYRNGWPARSMAFGAKRIPRLRQAKVRRILDAS